MYINKHFYVEGFKHFIFYTSDHKIKLAITKRPVVPGPTFNLLAVCNCSKILCTSACAFICIYYASMASETIKQNVFCFSAKT
jgi:hypothetical protein